MIARGGVDIILARIRHFAKGPEATSLLKERALVGVAGRTGHSRRIGARLGSKHATQTLEPFLRDVLNGTHILCRDSKDYQYAAR